MNIHARSISVSSADETWWLPGGPPWYVPLLILVPLSFSSFSPSVAAQVNAQPPTTGVSAKIVRYARRLVAQYDKDGDRRLEQDEWRRMGGDPRRADANGDGVITLEEMARHVANYSLRRKIRLRSPGPEMKLVFPSILQSPNDAVSLSQQQQPTASPAPEVKRTPRFHVPKSELPEGLPEWFTQRDADGDGQLTQAEYTEGVPRADMRLFARCDANGDGVVTARECARVAKTLQKKQPAGSESAKKPAAGSATKKTGGTAGK